MGLLPAKVSVTSGDSPWSGLLLKDLGVNLWLCYFENRLLMIRIVAGTKLCQTVQGDLAKCTELRTDESTGGIIKPCQEVSERHEHTRQVHGRELLNRVKIFDG